MVFNIYNTGFDNFGFFLALALIFLFTCFSVSGMRKFNIPFFKLTGIYFITVLFLITGSKLFTIEFYQWKDFISGGSFPATTKLTVIGALAFGPVGLWIGKHLFNVKAPFLDSVAIPVLIAMGIQRLGCLFAGCCHGLPTNSGFGISYGPGTLAHFHFFKHGWLSSFTENTAAVHPVPLYLLLCCLISAMVLFMIRPKIKTQGTFFILAIACFVFGRFFVEFFRDPLTNGSFGNIVFGLKKAQWIFLVVSFVLFSIALVREKKGITTNTFSETTYHRNFLPVIVVTLLSMVVCFVSRWFTPLEKSLFILFSSLFFISSCYYFINYYFPNYKRSIHAFSIVCFIILVLPMTAQVAFDNSKDTCYSYKEVSLNGAFHSFFHYHQAAIPNPNSCGGYFYDRYYTHNVYTGGVSFSAYQNLGRYKRLFYKASAYAGNDTDDDPQHRDAPQTQAGINTYGGAFIIGGDTKIVGIEGGLIAGTFRAMDSNTGQERSSLSGGVPEFGIMPVGRLRVGFTKIIFFDGRAGYPVFGFNSSKYPVTVGIGTGLGRDNGSILRLGVGIAGNKPIGSLSLKIVAHNKWAGEVGAGIGESYYFNASVSYFFHAYQGNRLKKLLQQ